MPSDCGSFLPHIIWWALWWPEWKVLFLWKFLITSISFEYFTAFIPSGKRYGRQTNVCPKLSLIWNFWWLHYKYDVGLLYTIKYTCASLHPNNNNSVIRGQIWTKTWLVQRIYLEISPNACPKHWTPNWYPQYTILFTTTPLQIVHQWLDNYVFKHCMAMNNRVSEISFIFILSCNLFKTTFTKNYYFAHGR